MVNVGLVTGSASQAKEVVISQNIVYVHSDIQPALDEEGNVINGLFTYNEIQYTKDEYISLMDEKNKFLESESSALVTLSQITTGGQILENDSIDKNYEIIKALQFTGATKRMFNMTILPDFIDQFGKVLLEKIEKFLEYSPMYDIWENGNTLLEGAFVQYGKDENDYVKVYQTNKTHVIQDNINPDTDSGKLIYELIGYHNNKRIWTMPFSKFDSYSLNEIVPKLTITDYGPIMIYGLGNVLMRNEVFLYNNQWYKVIVQQITVSEYINPESPEQIAYERIPYVEFQVLGDTVRALDFVMYKSLKDDNRFEPGPDSSVWALATDEEIAAL